MKTTTYNFGAGPAMLPPPVLCEAQAELLNWQGLGMSVMEMGHRTAEVQALMMQLETDLRALLTIPMNYHVLFLGGAARTQFSMVPMNLLSKGQQAGYVVSGLWSSLAYEEALKLNKTQAYCVATTETHDLANKLEYYALRDDTAYVYYTPNETVNGVRMPVSPKVGAAPLVADMTSCLLSEPIKVSDFGLIFAGAQKNISIAGLTVVIVRKDWLENPMDGPIPTMMDYRIHAEHRSLYATPPVFNCYLAASMLRWIKSRGGVEALYLINQRKAALLYQYIDASSFYHCPVSAKTRSLVNVCFGLVNQALEPLFIMKATERGLYALQGHRTVGGLRASLYNAMPIEGVESLISFMEDFSKEHAR